MDNQAEASATWNSSFDHDFPAKPNQVPKRIHILGVGSVGLFIAHSLAGIPNRPPITFLSGRKLDPRFNGPTIWREAGERVEVITDGVSVVRRGFDHEPVPDGPAYAANRYADRPEINLDSQTRSSRGPEVVPNTNKESLEPLDEAASSTSKSTLGPENTTIWNLVVSVKAPNTVIALSRVAHRLCRDSTITFLQNGMGIIDEVNRQLFPDVEERPNYVLGVISHGVIRISPYSVRHAGFGTIAIGIQPRKKGSIERFPPTARYIVRTITRTPLLAAVPMGPTEFQEQQLDKLAVNSVINPLTAICDCTNGQLIENFFFLRVFRLLLAETSLVIRSLPELKGIPNVNLRYDPERLEKVVIGIATNTAENVSSMLQDVRVHKKTEIDYINGYIVRRGEEMGIKCITNFLVMQLVKARGKMVQKAALELLPDDLPDTITTYGTTSTSLSAIDE